MNRWPSLILALVMLMALPVTATQAQERRPEATEAPSTRPAHVLTPSASLVPGAAETDTDDVDRVAEILAGMTLRQKVGQLFTTRVYGFRAKDPAPGAKRSNRRYLGVDDAHELLERFPVGGVVYFDYTGNLQRPRQIARLSNGIQRAARAAGTVGVLISTDQEHGVVARVGPPATRFPGSMALGATRDPELAREAARVSGEELHALGIDQDLAPVADVNSDAGNPVIGLRAFGSRPALVAAMTRAQVLGFEEDAGIAATVKHFPGHGDTDIDSHDRLPTIRHSRSRWWALDAPPFEAAIEAGVDVIMTAHVAVPSLDPSRRPATLSRPILTGILRERMGYDGVIMTDSLTMAAVRERFGDKRVPVLALKAGSDMLADPPHLPTAFRAVMRAVQKGQLSERRIDASVERILRLKEGLGLLDHPELDVDEVEATLGTPDNQAVAESVAETSVTVIRDRASHLPLRPGWTVLLTGWNDAGVRRLGDELRALGRTVESEWVGARPSRSRIDRIVRRARKHDVTVVTTGYLGAYPRHRELIRALRRDGRVVMISVRSPYDAAWFEKIPTQVATYSSLPVSMRALAGVIAGSVGPSGKLPVSVPSPSGRGDAFPFGAGEHWEPRPTP